MAVIYLLTTAEKTTIVNKSAAYAYVFLPKYQLVNFRKQLNGTCALYMHVWFPQSRSMQDSAAPENTLSLKS